MKNYCNVLEQDTKYRIVVKFMLQLLQSANIKVLSRRDIANG